jgi:hypothetical protein
MPRSRPPHDPYGYQDPAVVKAVDRREEGRRRVSHTTRWALAAAAAGATVLGAGYAHALPGTSADSSTGTTSTTSTDGSGSTDPNSSSGFQAPNQAPAPATEAPQTHSGAS